MIDTFAPPRFEHHPENVPEELKAHETWVCCDELKAPLVATLSGAVYAASSTDKTTWRSYDEAYKAWLDNEWSFAGVGRVITRRGRPRWGRPRQVPRPGDGRSHAVGNGDDRSPRLLRRDLAVRHGRQDLDKGTYYYTRAREARTRNLSPW